MNYTIRGADGTPKLETDWHDPFWSQAETLEISHFLPESSSHHPRTQVRLLYDERGIRGIFQVHDQYVRCVRTNYFDEVWKDSCVEFFAEPQPDRGYFNFEFNCGGAFLCCHILDPERVPGGFREFTKVPASLGGQIKVCSSLPSRIEAEIADPVVWTLRFSIPFAFFEHYLGPLGDTKGQVWRGNFFKCAEEISHPHWAAWAPVDKFDFHRPECFGTLRFV
ncbi:MAG TPA: carbohydrate-binding family 9-like protein [Candidatus Binatia bacterium]|nr:carbohydrate-binding family 9-like protein [Candidatus Binatia bacterium]